MRYTVQHIQAHMDNTLIVTAPTGLYDDGTHKLTVPAAEWNANNKSTTMDNQIKTKTKVSVAVGRPPQPVPQPVIGAGRAPAGPAPAPGHAGPVIGAGRPSLAFHET
jgi:hypothetical protein